MKLSAEQKTVCQVSSRRDKLGWVHCDDCPMVLDNEQSACLATVSEDDARRFYRWSGHPFPKLEGGSGNAEPTEKQVAYAEYLAHRMCQELPREYTRNAYAEFIDKWKPVVKHEDDAMNEPSAWQVQYM